MNELIREMTDYINHTSGKQIEKDILNLRKGNKHLGPEALSYLNNILNIKK